ncbi:neprilysin-2-like [Microplitis mediator]|uniref:neprilysin-2-like n=1 Tax=Microplitis mediator TaxID=375433 RepID=UPI00255521FF|nr:neprilysin-2-like [Microplitis mediator]
MARDSPHPFRPFKFLEDSMTSCHNMFANNYNLPPGVAEDKLDYLNELISKLGGWPAVEGDKWNETNFDWIDFTLKASEIGVSHEVFLRRGLEDHQNFTKFLVLNPPMNSFFYDHLAIPAFGSGDSAYFDFMRKVAQFLGGNKTLTANEFTESVAFELEISKVARGSFTHSLTDGNKTYGMSVKEMSEKWPRIDWIKFLNFPKASRLYITNDSIIFIKNHDYVTRLEELITETPKRVQANYAVWKTVQSVIPFVHSTSLIRLWKIYNKRLTMPDTATPWCFLQLQLPVPELMLSYYVHHHPLDSKVKSQIDLMILDVKQTLIDMINKENWLDDESRNQLVEDIESLRVITGYPEVLLDDKKMEEYFQGLEPTSGDFLRSVHAAIAFQRNKIFTTALKPSDQTNWIDLLHRKIDLDSTAFTLMRINVIGLGIPVLGNLYFSTNRPSYANYATLGSTASHEIGHIVDHSKTFLDNYAFAHNRWSSFSVEKFEEKSNCLIEQLGNFTFRGTEKKLNGQFLIAETIGDQIGIEVAYSAYQDWVKVHGTEPTIPNLPYNSNQLFWLSYANQWCESNWRLDKSNLNDPHPPYDKRVNVPLLNTPEFSKDFHCPLGSKMNPVKKCQIFE